ncbi:kinase suppressor of Ras (KSR), putative, partial [Ixodes scapularis]
NAPAMADAEAENKVKSAVEACVTAQAMIDINSEHLDGLRTQCATSVELTQNEIRALETKLIKLFSRQVVAKKKYAGTENANELQHYPKLVLWLKVVGLSAKSIEGLSNKLTTFDDMLEKPEQEVKGFLSAVNAREEEKRRFLIAMRNLKAYTGLLTAVSAADRQLRGDVGTEVDLHWDSWDRGSVGQLPRRVHTSVPSEELCGGSRLELPRRVHTSVPSEELCGGSRLEVGRGGGRPPTTPPPSKRPHAPASLGMPDALPLTKSRSHEAHLENRLEGGPEPQGLPLSKSYKSSDVEAHQVAGWHPKPKWFSQDRWRVAETPCHRARPGVGQLPTSLPEPFAALQPDRLLEILSCHPVCRFTSSVKVTTCQQCDKAMFFGYKCKECKFRCHRDCMDKVPPSCGLPNELVDVFAEHIQKGVQQTSRLTTWTARCAGIQSPNHSQHFGSPLHVVPRSEGGRGDKSLRHHPALISIPPFHHGADSSSNTSSCNSSTPSSPAFVLAPPGSRQNTPSSASRIQQFHFPGERSLRALRLGGLLSPLADISVTEKELPAPTSSLARSEVVESLKSTDSDRTVSGTSGSGSISVRPALVGKRTNRGTSFTDSEKTLASTRVDSQDSQVSDMDPTDRAWPRQNSLSLREWDIPFDDVQIEEKLGEGRFGSVYKGNWHGSVAVKMLNMDHIDDRKTLETFKQEVATFRKTRHENLVLFMGACMKPPKLAIITSLCKGMTLYRHIHLRKDKFNLNRISGIALQICQGMGYLHARGIVHKDLKTKNIFYENGKVVITDFGLFSVTKLCHGNRLRAGKQYDADDLPFTTTSDIYAFGTVWYELLCGEWPFRGQPSESIIWQVARGIKQSLANIQASQDIKDFLMVCWSYKPQDRPAFSKLQVQLQRLPKKRLARSPSHPTHLSRSAESAF